MTGGRSNAIPGALVWGALGLAGQATYNTMDEQHTHKVVEEAQRGPAAEQGPSMMDRVFRSKWNPIKKLTDDEYERMLEGKLLAVNAELANTNEAIAELERAEAGTK